MNWLQYIALAIKAAGPVIVPPLLAELEAMDTPNLPPYEKIPLEAAIAWLKTQLPTPPAGA